MRTQKINKYMQDQRKQYGLKHCFTATVHAAISDTLKKVTLQKFDIILELWDKAQVLVALTREKKGGDLIFVGNK